ncbi:MAG: glycosyltransferase family 2 protein [Roseivirga sp.]|nr:glycosyltransferase family 2 protein [Roseivirga sp.]
MKKPLVSIITVNYQQSRVTCELLDTIRALSYPNIETIIVDNAQQQDDTTLYRSHLPKVKVINSAVNLGFAGANNLGIKAAKGEYMFLLNNDTEIADGTLEQLLACFDGPRIGAVSPVLRYHSQPEKVQYAGFTEINPMTGRNMIIDEVQKKRTVDTPYFHGAAVLIPKAVIDQCGLMPEDYFLYYEELDWSRIFTKKGFKLKVCTTACIMHKESVTTGKNSPLKTYYQTRNRVAFMNKHSSPLSKLLFNLFFHMVSLPTNLFRYGIKGKKEHLIAFLRAFMDASVYKKAGMTF